MIDDMLKKSIRDEKMTTAPSHLSPAMGPPQSRPLAHPNRLPPSRAFPRMEPIDREKTCPFLLRVFTKIGEHHTMKDFAVRGRVPKDEVQIYTWKDASLRELTDLVKEVFQKARIRTAKLSFALVYPQKDGHFVLKVVGTTNSSSKSVDDGRVLAELGFQIGDYLDVAIL